MIMRYKILLFLKTKQLCAICCFPKGLGLRNRTNCLQELFKNMDLIDGHTLPDLYPIDWANNVDRDGIIILIPTRLRENGKSINT